VSRARSTLSKRKAPFEKYDYYEKAVQSTEVDVEFLRNAYFRLRQKYPTSLREDFCGTFALCAQWIQYKKHHTAFGVDLDPEPIAYGQSHYAAKMTAEERSRLKVFNQNVLNPKLPKADIVCAMNFSYFIFKKRNDLKTYLANALKHLNKDGVLILDCFGGPACQKPIEDRHRKDGFYYYWDQKSWDPITHEAEFQIHFQPFNGKKHKNVFNYDWRMWSVAEIRDLMAEVGFKRSAVFWEGTSRNGSGNGKYAIKERVFEPDTEAWVCYVAGVK
jgi:SAM-dependent methyltransferase